MFKIKLSKRKKLTIFISAIVGIMFFMIFLGFQNDSQEIEKSRVIIITENSRISVNVEIADDLLEQKKGLMYRENLEWNDGMFFVYEFERDLIYWMKNTYIPLDMIFINQDFRIVDIKENIQPCLENKCPTYPANDYARYALEVNAGFVEKNKIKTGDKIEYLK